MSTANTPRGVRFANITDDPEVISSPRGSPLTRTALRRSRGSRGRSTPSRTSSRGNPYARDSSSPATPAVISFDNEPADDFTAPSFTALGMILSPVSSAATGITARSFNSLAKSLLWPEEVRRAQARNFLKGSELRQPYNIDYESQPNNILRDELRAI
ncbi:hypothetical protein MY4824_007874 [Beauveria thailandica]